MTDHTSRKRENAKTRHYREKSPNDNAEEESGQWFTVGSIGVPPVVSSCY